jgi:hypothetical protein
VTPHHKSSNLADQAYFQSISTFLKFFRVRKSASVLADALGASGNSSFTSQAIPRYGKSDARLQGVAAASHSGLMLALA